MICEDKTLVNCNCDTECGFFLCVNFTFLLPHSLTFTFSTSFLSSPSFRDKILANLKLTALDIDHHLWWHHFGHESFVGTWICLVMSIKNVGDVPRRCVPEITIFALLTDSHGNMLTLSLEIMTQIWTQNLWATDTDHYTCVPVSDAGPASRM